MVMVQCTMAAISGTARAIRIRRFIASHCGPIAVDRWLRAFPTTPRLTGDPTPSAKTTLVLW